MKKITGLGIAMLMAMAFIAHPQQAEAATPKAFRTTGTVAVTAPAQAKYIAEGATYNYGVTDDAVIVLSKTASDTQIARVPLTGGGNDIIVSGQYLYVAMPGSGFAVFSLTNPALPAFVTSTGAYGAGWSIEVSGSYLIETHAIDGRLVIYNITDPAHPIVTGNLNLGMQIYGLDVSGNYAYVAAGAAGLKIVNIAAPATPVLTGTYDTPGFTYDVDVVGSFAYLADLGVRVVNVADPANPASVGFISSKQGYRIQVINPELAEPFESRYVAMAMAENGVGIFDINEWNRPALRGVYEVTHSAYGMMVDETTMIVGAGNAGFKYIDLRRVVHKVIFNMNVVRSRLFILRPNNFIRIVAPFKLGERVVAWKITLCSTATTCNYYLAGRFDPKKPVILKLYDANGKQLSTVQPFTGPTAGANIRFFHRLGDDRVFFAIAPRGGRSLAKIYEVTSTGIKFIQQLTTASVGKHGDTIVAFVQLNAKGDLVLVTRVRGSSATPKFWRYNTFLKRFVEDRTSNLPGKITIIGSQIIAK